MLFWHWKNEFCENQMMSTNNIRSSKLLHNLRLLASDLNNQLILYDKLNQKSSLELKLSEIPTWWVFCRTSTWTFWTSVSELQPSQTESQDDVGRILKCFSNSQFIIKLFQHQLLLIGITIKIEQLIQVGKDRRYPDNWYINIRNLMINVVGRDYCFKIETLIGIQKYNECTNFANKVIIW